MSLWWLLLLSVVTCQQMADQIQSAANPLPLSSFPAATTNRLMTLTHLSINVIIEEDVIEVDMIPSLYKKTDFTRLFRHRSCDQSEKFFLQPFSFTQPLENVESDPRYLVYKQTSKKIITGYSSLSSMASLSRYQNTTRMFDITFVYGNINTHCKQQFRPRWERECKRRWRRFWRKKCWWVIVYDKRPLTPVEIEYIKNYMHARLVEAMKQKVTSEVVSR